MAHAQWTCYSILYNVSHPIYGTHNSYTQTSYTIKGTLTIYIYYKYHMQNITHTLWNTCYNILYNLWYSMALTRDVHVKHLIQCTQILIQSMTHTITTYMLQHLVHSMELTCNTCSTSYTIHTLKQSMTHTTYMLKIIYNNRTKNIICSMIFAFWITCISHVDT